MGGSNEKVQISLTVDTPVVVAGGECIANVHLSIKENIKASQLVLRFYGKEKAEKTKRRIEAWEIPVNIWDGDVVPRNQYTFPIIYEIPPNIPGSFVFEQFSIKYYLEGALLSRKGKTLVSDKAEIVVNQEAENLRGSINDQFSISVKGLCFSRGIVQANVRTDKLGYLPQDTIEASLQVDNSLGVGPTRQISYCLTRILKHRSRNITSKYHLMAESKDFVLGKHRANAPINFRIPLSTRLDELKTTGSTSGTLFECQYALEFILAFSNCVSSVQFQYPIQIHPTEREPRRMPQAPENWNPIEMPVSRLIFSSGIRFEPSAPPIEDDSD